VNDRERYFLNQPRRVPLGLEAFAGDRQFATTLARGLELLRCFSATDVQPSNAELAARTRHAAALRHRPETAGHGAAVEGAARV